MGASGWEPAPRARDDAAKLRSGRGGHAWSRPDVAVVGGGAIGCSVAYHLACAGARVVLLERGRIGDEASSCAAGMLAPQVEAEEPGPFFDLGLYSRNLVPALAAALREETGWDVEVDFKGILRVAGDEASAQALRARAAWQRAAGLHADWLDQAAAHELVADLNAVYGALWVRDGSLSAPRFVGALAEAAARRGVVLHEGVQVTGFLPTGGVTTSGGPMAAGAVVVCAGAWSGQMELGCPCPVRPVKGQILRLRALPREPRLPVFGDSCYVVPKGDGRVVVGATMEEAGFDRRPTLGAVARLGAGAVALLPALADAAVEATLAGLRPATPDGLPVLGRAPGCEGVFLATGHFRNGILLAAATGRVIADLVAGRTPEVDLTPFSPRRFQPEPGMLE